MRSLKKEVERLKAQCVLSSSLGRTRSRKFEEGSIEDESLSKKMKSDEDVETPKSNLGVEKGLLGEIGEKKNLGESGRRFTRSALKSSIGLGFGLGSLKLNGEGAGVESPVVVEESMGVEVGLIGESVRRVTRSAVKSILEAKISGGSKKNNLGESPSPFTLSSIGVGLGSGSCSDLKLDGEGAGVETPTVVDESMGVDVGLIEDHPRRITRSVGKPMLEAKVSGGSKKNNLGESPRRFTHSALKLSVGLGLGSGSGPDFNFHGEGDGVECPVVVDESMGVEVGLIGESSRRVTRSGAKFLLEPKASGESGGHNALSFPRKNKFKGDVLKETGGSLDKSLINGGEKNNLVEPMTKDEFRRLFSHSGLKSPGERSHVETPFVVDETMGVEAASIGKSGRRLTRSAAKSMVLQKCQSAQSKPEVMAESVKISEEKTTWADEGTAEILDSVIDDSRGLTNDSIKIPERRITRKALESMEKNKVIETTEIQTASMEKPQSPPSNSEVMADAHEHTEGNSIWNEEANVGNLNLEQANTEAVKNNEKPVRRITRSALKIREDSLMPRQTFATKEVEATSPNKRLKTLTRSASKVETMAFHVNLKAEKCLPEKNLEGKLKMHSMVRNVHNASREKSMRWSTHQAWEETAEPVVVPLADVPSGSSTPTVLEDDCVNPAVTNSDRGTTGVISKMRTPPKKKLEMKMSKKIALTNPSKVRELLQTGMLEGLHVKYVYVGEKDKGLDGIIKDCGILCACTMCKGCKVVKPIQFGRHAGSTNRNPVNYIYLDNGKSLLDVLNACKDASLDMLEVTIQNAVSSLTVGNAICLMCKCPLPVLRAMKKRPLCHECCKSKKCHPNFACSASTASRSSQPTSAPNSSACTMKRKSKQREASGKKLRSSKSNFAPSSSDNMPNCISRQTQNREGKLTKKDMRLHTLVFQEDGLPDGTQLAYFAHGKRLCVGHKSGTEIKCTCCKKLMSPSQFEKHAGHGRRRKPYMHIYTSDGISLHEFSLSLSKVTKFSVNENDDLCSICGDFGDLLLCDGCPRSFHKECVGEQDVSQDDWYCAYCQKGFDQEKMYANNANAKAAGRVAGVDPLELISNRCTRIINTPKLDIGGCILCRSQEFTPSGFGPKTVIICDQCERDFHVGCLKDHGMEDLKTLPEGKWFCSGACSKIHSTLQNLIDSGPEKLPDSLIKVIKKDNSKSCSSSDIDLNWKFLSGKTIFSESRSLLAKTVAIFHESFDPIRESSVSRDLIPAMVYGISTRVQEFGGMYCAVLTVNSSVVSAGILRIFGQELAELPLVATSNGYQGKGYFKLLFTCIEKLLSFLKVKTLVLPAAPEAEAIWTKKFGFQKMDEDQIYNYMRDYQFMRFEGTSMLHKTIPECRMIHNSS